MPFGALSYHGTRDPGASATPRGTARSGTPQGEESFRTDRIRAWVRNTLIIPGAAKDSCVAICVGR